MEERSRLAGLPTSLFLLLVVAAVTALALWGIFTARRGARESALTELSLETAAHARSLEAVLATLRGDLVFLSRSPPLVRYLETATSTDPLVRRWSRLDVEGTLLLFLQAHPAVRSLELHGMDDEVLVRAGRQRDAPVILPVPEDPDTPVGDASSSDRPARWPGTFPLGGSPSDARSLEVRIDPQALLAIAAPGLEDRLVLTAEVEDLATAPESHELVVRSDFAEPQWSPPIRGTLVRREAESRLIASVETLAGRYRTTVLLYALVMTLTLVLGTVALSQARRAAQTEAARRHEAQVRELERQLFHHDRLASLGRLAAGLAHEINNPLEGMSNYLTLLEEDLHEGRTDTAERSLSRLRQGLDRAAGAVRQVLAFADPEQSAKQRLDVGRVVQEAVDFVRGNPAFRQVTVRCEIPAAPLPVEGHRAPLGQLFLNLLLNACQVQPEGGEVEVRAETEKVAETAEVTASENGDRNVARGVVRISIADRGPGLPPGLGRRIFEPFVSTRGSSGLGLSVCQRIVEEHRGAVTARDRSDGGAVFEVILPFVGTRSG